MKARDQERYEAMCTADTDALNDILHRDFYYTHSSGRVESKTSYIAAIASGAVRYSNPRTSETVYQQYAKTILMRGIMQLDCHARNDRHVALKNVFTAIWVKETGDWQLVSWSSTHRP